MFTTPAVWALRTLAAVSGGCEVRPHVADSGDALDGLDDLGFRLVVGDFAVQDHRAVLDRDVHPWHVERFSNGPMLERTWSANVASSTLASGWRRSVW